MARAIRMRGSVEPVFVESLDEVQPVLEGLLTDGDLLLTMGAGDIGAYAAGLPERLSNGPSLKVHS
jgi:UDP-N-acetylmuramate--alanine ligase